MRSTYVKVAELGRIKGHRAYVTNHEVILELEPSQCKSFAEHIAKSASGAGITRIVAKWTRRNNDGFDVLVLSTAKTSASSNGYSMPHYDSAELPKVGSDSHEREVAHSMEPAAQLMQVQQVEYPQPQATPREGGYTQAS